MENYTTKTKLHEKKGGRGTQGKGDKEGRGYDEGGVVMVVCERQTFLIGTGVNEVNENGIYWLEKNKHNSN